ncbi:MAG: NAD(P)/FAD-dependent oxidoreductase [Chloroflexota bacterium]
MTIEHTQNGTTTSPNTYDAVIVGAGFSGLYMLYRLREIGLSVRVFEAGDGVGGTWYWNRYPGARCDVESIDYSYSFSPELEQEWEWTERYPSQPEILRYLEHVADRFSLRPDIQLETRVTAASFNEATNRWHIETDQDEMVQAQFCIMATGCLSKPNRPHYQGLEKFKGATYHTGLWPKEDVDFTGKRVGVIGTGSSAIQSIPVIAHQADHLYVFQRTPNFSLPAANRPLDSATQQTAKTNYPERRQIARESAFGMPLEINDLSLQSVLDVPPEEREQELERRWEHGGFAMLAAFSDIIINKESNDTVAEFVRDKIREKVDDPTVANLLAPTNHPFATKRPCVDIEYYETYNRDNVTLVDMHNEPIEAITEQGLRTSEGEYTLDALVFATGFDAMTGALFAIDIRSKNNQSLKEKWSSGPRTYLGLMTAGFPNLYTITGPGSPSVLSNMIVSIEQHVEWITDAIKHMRTQGKTIMEASVKAEDDWVQHVMEVGDATLHPLANSWYVGANIPGKPRVFMPYIGGVGNYRMICDQIAANDYEGFVFTKAEALEHESGVREA